MKASWPAGWAAAGRWGLAQGLPERERPTPGDDAVITAWRLWRARRRWWAERDWRNRAHQLVAEAAMFLETAQPPGSATDHDR